MSLKPKKKKRRRRGYKRGLHKSLKGGECRYRSGWELAYITWLDANPDVLSFSYEQIIIEYLSNKRTGKVRKYFPDFFVEYVDGHKELIEIKPKKRLEQVKVRKKIEAAMKWSEAHHVGFRIITETELKGMDLI